MLSKENKRSIVRALPNLHEMRQELKDMRQPYHASDDFNRLIDCLYSQVFAVICQFEKKLSENAYNEATQLELTETVGKDAKGIPPVYAPRLTGNRFDPFEMVKTQYCPEFWTGK